MLWEGSDDAVVCLHSGLSVPRSTDHSRRKQKELLKSHSQTLHLLCSTAWNRHPPQSNGIWELKPSGSLFWGITDPGACVWPVSAEDPSQTWGPSGARTQQQAESCKHLQVPQTCPLQREMCPADPRSSSCSIPALLTGTGTALHTKPQWAGTNRVIRSPWSRSQQKLLVCPLPHLDRIQVWFSSTAPAHWKLWSWHGISCAAQQSWHKTNICSQIFLPARASPYASQLFGKRCFLLSFIVMPQPGQSLCLGESSTSTMWCLFYPAPFSQRAEEQAWEQLKTREEQQDMLPWLKVHL